MSLSGESPAFRVDLFSLTTRCRTVYPDLARFALAVVVVAPWLLDATALLQCSSERFLQLPDCRRDVVGGCSATPVRTTFLLPLAFAAALVQ